MDEEQRIRDYRDTDSNYPHRTRDEELRMRDDRRDMTPPNSERIQDIAKILKDASIRTVVTSQTKMADVVWDKRKSKTR